MAIPGSGPMGGPGPARPAPWAAIVGGPRDGIPSRYAVRTPDGTRWATPETLAAVVREVDREWGPRWTWWAAHEVVPLLLAGGVVVHRSWDVAEAHRVLHGGWVADPGSAWAAAHDLAVGTVPGPPTGDLFEFASSRGDDGSLIRPDGHLRADAVAGDWLAADDRLEAWVDALLVVVDHQASAARSLGPRVEATIHSESAAAVLCCELAAHGLPIDRATATTLITAAAGPQPASIEDEVAGRRVRDSAVLALVPGRESTDLRNPADVRAMLAAVGVDVPNTRKWVLEPHRHTHPVVAALLAWRKDERIATTYGHRWLDSHVGQDDRLRGRWTACDGGGGRMTAENGLHNLPAELRHAVAADPGRVFVRADLGQIEPRVLAVVSGDAAFADATRADDLYAPVAARLGVERAVAKVAVLAAMYGQRSGAAGEALKGLERAYPVAMAHLDAAYAVGVRGGELRTWGGRLIRTGAFVRGAPIGSDPAADAARGRFARNAVIQGAAAELFKAWANTVRAAVLPWGAQIVLCLHDELLVHAPADSATEVAAAVDTALADAARRWTRGAAVRFVADTSVISRWSQAK